MTQPDPVSVAEPEDNLSGRFVAVALVLGVIITILLCFALPAVAGQVSETTTPSGSISDGRVSLQPQPGWELLANTDPDQSSEQVLTKEGVTLGLVTVPADRGTDPQTYLDLMVEQFDGSLVPDYEPVAFETPTGDQGVAVMVTGTNEAGMLAAIVSRDGAVAALVPVIGDPVASSALINEISEMITSIRIKRAS